MKRWLVASLLIVVFAAIIAIFWRIEYIYTLPTPIPENYRAVNTGQNIDLPNDLNTIWAVNSAHSKPLFLHFFNPDCPCSKFNVSYFKTLVKKYGSEASFAIVVMSSKKFTTEEIQHKFNTKVPVVFDSAIAAACGVYSTPQAAIITPGNKLYYRGNYNKARYCTDAKSNYAEIALTNFINDKPLTVFSRFATQAYGCTLPTCFK